MFTEQRRKILFFKGGIFALFCSAAASLFFDISLMVKFFPQIFTNYEMYLFDSEHFDMKKNFSQASLDIISHYSIANMTSHSLILVVLLVMLLKNPTFKKWGLISLYFFLTIGSKLFFFYSIFGGNAYFYLPSLTLLVGLVGFLMILIYLIFNPKFIAAET